MQLAGYHGTDTETSDVILRKGWTPSRDKNSWYGMGVYFFGDYPPLSNGFSDAKAWATRARKYKKWVVLKSTIESTNFIDFADFEERILYFKIAKKLLHLHKQSGKKIDEFDDKIVINHLFQRKQFDFIRLFIDKSIDMGYNSYIIDWMQVYILVKNPDCIKDTIILTTGKECL